jgi:glycosyltransferase involved in cell wall biosynthesis
VVIASSTYPMDIWVARRIARLAGARLVYEVHDLWPLSPRNCSACRAGTPSSCCASGRGHRLPRCRPVVSMLPKVHDYMASRGLDLRKLTIVPNGITLEEWQGDAEALGPAVQATLQAARAAGRRGRLCRLARPAQRAGHLLDARALRDEPPCSSCWSVTATRSPPGHARAGRRAGQRAACCRPFRRRRSRHFLAAIDIAYIGWQRVPIYRFGIAPNKLMDYMMAGCVVLHAVEAGNDPVAEAGCGLTVPPESPRPWPTACAGWPRCRWPSAVMGARGRAFVLAHHTYPVLAQRFLQAMGAPA